MFSYFPLLCELQLSTVLHFGFEMNDSVCFSSFNIFVMCSCVAARMRTQTQDSNKRLNSTQKHYLLEKKTQIFNTKPNWELEMQNSKLGNKPGAQRRHTAMKVYDTTKCRGKHRA